uniref:Uncharacterized protein n=1 Tax=Anopheles albimanus TaxID=7167 RepID=A0A182FWZ4_ANOAL
MLVSFGGTYGLQCNGGGWWLAKCIMCPVQFVFIGAEIGCGALGGGHVWPSVPKLPANQFHSAALQLANFLPQLAVGVGSLNW